MFLKPFKLKDKVEFNSEKFSSCIIKDEGDKKILLIALEKNQILPKHSVPTKAYIYILEGEVVFFIDDNEYRVKKEEMLILEENVPHFAKGGKKSKFMVIRA